MNGEWMSDCLRLCLLLELAKCALFPPVAGPGHLQPPPAPVTGGGEVMTNSSGPEKGPTGTMATVNTTAAPTTVQPTATPDTPATAGAQIGPPRLPPRPIHQSHGRSVSVDLKLKSDVGRSKF